MKRGALQESAIDALRPVLSYHNRRALELWRDMGGLDWTALPLLVALYDITEPGEMIWRLICIRDEST